jgi:hypothetical protein
MIRRPGTRWPVHGSMETSLNQDHPSSDLRLGLNEPKGYLVISSGQLFRFGRCDRVLFFCSLGWDRGWEAPWPMTWASSSSSLSYSAQNKARFLRTRSWLWEELIFRTYRGENEPWEAGDREAAQAVFNGGGDGMWWHFGSKDSSGGDGVGGGSSSKRQTGTGGSGVAARWRRRGSAMSTRVWAKFAGDKALFIGVLVLNHRRQKSKYLSILSRTLSRKDSKEIKKGAIPVSS